MQKLKILFFLLSLSLNLFAQETESLDAISAIENDSKVYLRWTMKSGSTCNGIRIYRSKDSTSFNTIGQINGICGSSTESISYDFVDESPVLNAVNYYTIELGSLGFSKVISVEVFDFKNGILIRPQPTSSSVELVFRNDLNEKYTLQVLNLQGKVMHEKSNNSDRFQVDMNFYPMGVYVYKIYNNDNVELSSGKLLKQ
jgi:Secretion system C-terminal sorting domain